MRATAFLAATILSGCSCGTSATGSDAGGTDVGALPDGGGTDAAGTDGGTGADAASCPEPGPGADTFMAECGSGSTGGFMTQVAILLRPGGGARMRVVGRVPGARTPCDAWDSIDVLHDGSLVATLPAGGAFVSTFGDGMTPWAEGDVDPSVALLCGDETGRFDSMSLVVHARTDGGTLTLTCGGGLGSPTIVLTCHQGIEPPLPDTIFHHSITDDRTALQAWFPDMPAEVVSIDPDVRVLRGARPFDPPLGPVDTTGWTFSAWATQPAPPGGRALDSLLAGAPGRPLGADCAMAPVTGPDFPPVLIARVTGMTTTGPFSTELYSEGCFSSP